MSRARNVSGGYRLLILDGHNSHCTYQFCSFAEKNKIIILCLPSHTTHVLQPCDVGVFGPLSSSWKSEVNKLTRAGIPVTKFNLLEHYAHARERAFKPETIQSAFRKTGIEPLDRDALDPIVFEPALNTTTKSAQPLGATLPVGIPIEILSIDSNNGGGNVQSSTADENDNPFNIATNLESSNHPPTSGDDTAPTTAPSIPRI